VLQSILVARPGQLHTVLIYIGSNAVYELSSSYMDAYYRNTREPNGRDGTGILYSIAPGTKIDAQDLYPRRIPSLPLAMSRPQKDRVSAVHRNMQFDVRFANDVAFGDLREHPRS